MFKLKYGTLTISNLQNSIAELTFFVFNWIYPFWVNFLLKIKIVSFKLDNSNMQNLILTFFVFLNGNTLFGQIWSKNQNCRCNLKFST